MLLLMSSSQPQAMLHMQEIWNAALLELKTKVNEHNFTNWFEKLRFLECSDETLVLGVDDPFVQVWVNDNYMDLIEQAVAHAAGQPLKIAIVESGQDEPIEVENIDLDAEPMAARSARLDGEHGQAALFDFGIIEPASPADLDALVSAAGMNPRYTFDEFVVGPSNQFTHAACQAVASGSGQTYNPLFIFGGVGLGKTHLLQAIGVEMLRRDPRTRVRYLSAEVFMNELIGSLRQKTMAEFRNQFRNDCDLLLIDDIQFIGGKDSTQEEFFHTFNALYQSGKQIVMTSDKTPQELPGIEERLASRFAWGLIADVQAPEIETRVAILEKKAEDSQIALSKEVVLLLATAIRSNVRELEGTLVRMVAQAKLMGVPLNTDLARQLLKRMNIQHERSLGVEQIIRMVASHFDIKPSDIKGSRRTRAISEPRQMAMYLSRKHTGESYPELGRKFGGKDHTTVLTAFRKIEDLVEMGNNEFATAIAELETLLLR
ncbi:chromosomal replication initiator protein DnaA [Lujinxingia vulgaris]|uniref:Chromosomal replication initiator protein DnaA n=1 Tax=Lujinxingia vulgaris TaxID=2600176 RepID=A0A5C6XIA9_9DELT|nr:chromosomal replication initiator protein DnaA [Lujinxingia vulgaris]TXD42658.1 chromosomal replication initiator protein DnaA [Lujinxingia vulgaris]